MGMLIVVNSGRGAYTNTDAVEKVIRYITRSRWNEDRRNELIKFGGAGIGVYLSPEEIIRQFLVVQEMYGIDHRGGRRIYHEVFDIFDEDMNGLNYDLSLVDTIAIEISRLFYISGHQVVYAIHCTPNKRVHIHFVVNTINYITGRKLHQFMADTKKRETVINECMRKYQYIVIRKVREVNKI